MLKRKKIFLIILAALLTCGAPILMLLINYLIFKRGFYYELTVPIGNVPRLYVTPDLLLNLVGLFSIMCGIIIFYYVMKGTE